MKQGSGHKKSAARTVKISARGPARTVKITAKTARSNKSSRAPEKSAPKSGKGKTTVIRKTKTRRSRRRPANSSLLKALIGSRALRAAIPVIFFVGVGAGLGAAARASWTWMTHSPRFQIREIVIRTGERVTRREIRTLADLSEGENILEFRLSECVEGIEVHPWVARASVMRQFPDRVVIDVVERRPVALISLGALYYVDHEGEIFKKILPGEDPDYPVITGLTLRDVVEDKEEIDPLIILALEIIGIASATETFGIEDISEIHLGRNYGATVVRAEDGMRIKIGRGELSDKWRRLERTIAELGDQLDKVAELDLNYESRVTVKLREDYRALSQVYGG